MDKVEVENNKYEVLDNLGYVHEVGAYVKEVKTATGPKKVIKRQGMPWRFWRVEDRLGR